MNMIGQYCNFDRTLNNNVFCTETNYRSQAWNQPFPPFIYRIHGIHIYFAFKSTMFIPRSNQIQYLSQSVKLKWICFGKFIHIPSILFISVGNRRAANNSQICIISNCRRLMVLCFVICQIWLRRKIGFIPELSYIKSNCIYRVFK